MAKTFFAIACGLFCFAVLPDQFRFLHGSTKFINQSSLRSVPFRFVFHPMPGLALADLITKSGPDLIKIFHRVFFADSTFASGGSPRVDDDSDCDTTKHGAPLDPNPPAEK